MPNLVINLLAVAAVGYIVWRIMSPKPAMRIVIDADGVKYHEGLPKSQESNVLAFLQQHLTPDGKLTICGSRQPGGYVRLSFKGPIDPGRQQQIRNFFNSIM